MLLKVLLAKGIPVITLTIIPTTRTIITDMIEYQTNAIEYIIFKPDLQYKATYNISDIDIHPRTLYHKHLKEEIAR